MVRSINSLITILAIFDINSLANVQILAIALLLTSWKNINNGAIVIWVNFKFTRIWCTTEVQQIHPTTTLCKNVVIYFINFDKMYEKQKNSFISIQRSHWKPPFKRVFMPWDRPNSAARVYPNRSLTIDAHAVTWPVENALLRPFAFNHHYLAKREWEKARRDNKY